MNQNAIGPLDQKQVIVTKINGQYSYHCETNSSYNQMPLDEHSRSLTKPVNGNQQYEFNRLFYDISIEPADFSAFMIKKPSDHNFLAKTSLHIKSMFSYSRNQIQKCLKF